MNAALHDCWDFVRRVRRRMVLARAAWRVLRMLALSGGAAVAALAILMTLGRPALPAMGAIVATGLLGGLFWAVWRIPGTLAAARWIDRQLQFSDLLTTALTQGDFDDPAWTQSVIALAAAQCRQQRPADVPVLSPPRWTAAAVAMELALVLALGIFFTPSGRNDPMAAVRESANQVDSPPTPIGTVVANAAALPRPAGDRNLDEQRSLGNTPDATLSSADAEAHSAAASHPRYVDANNGGASPTSGSGAAVTDVHSETNPQHDHTATGSSLTPDGTPAIGGTGLADSTAGGTTASGTVTPGQMPSANSNVSPVWTDVAADAAIRAGRVPAEDIDLVRDFFQPSRR